MPKAYEIRRERGRVRCRVIVDGARARTLRHGRRHSPTGFEFGYEGSGPAELARAITRDVLGAATGDSPRLYQTIKRQLIGTLKGDGPHVVTESDVRFVLSTVEPRER